MTSKWAGRWTDGWIETYHRWKGLSLLLEEKDGSLGKKIGLRKKKKPFERKKLLREPKRK